MTGFKNGAPAIKVWITKAMQKAMKRHRAEVNWSQIVRAAIMKKLKKLAED